MITFLKDKIRNIKYGIRNIIVWFPVIWHDRQWDHYYFHLLLKKKLELMRDFTLEYGCHLGSEKEAEKMDICVKLLNRIIKDEYIFNVYKNHDKKWGKSEFEFKDIPGTDMSKLKISRPGVRTKEDSEKERREFLRHHNHCEYLLNQDLDLLYKKIRKNIRGWWD